MLDRLMRHSVVKQLPPLYIFQAGARPAITSLQGKTRAITCLKGQTRAASTSTTPPPNDAATSRRRAVTIINDTGRVPWTNLSPAEKIARTTQQSFNFGMVALGIVLTGGVATVLYLEVFSTDSKTAFFNHAADRIRADPKCRELLASHGKRDISAHGEPSWSRWARNRTIASRLETDRAGVEHLHMHFYVEGPTGLEGAVQVHMARRRGKDFQYQLLALDVPGYPRHYLEDANSKLGLSKKSLFGINWTR